MIAVMEEHEQAPAAAEPRLLTRDELLAEIRRLGHEMTDRQLRDWVTDHILPRPERRLPPGATDGIARAVYPAWMIGVISDLWRERSEGASRIKLRRIAPERISYWQAHYGKGAVLSGSATAQPATGSGPGLTTTSAQPRRLQLAVWGYAARFAEQRNTRVTEAVLTLRTEDGTEVQIPIGPPRPPRKRHD